MQRGIPRLRHARAFAGRGCRTSCGTEDQRPKSKGSRRKIEWPLLKIESHTETWNPANGLINIWSVKIKDILHGFYYGLWY
jgi:hypothetical protein